MGGFLFAGWFCKPLYFGYGISADLKFESFSIAEKDKYYVQRKARNDEANQTYLKMLDDETDGIYIQDIMGGGIRNDDPRIPRNISE